MRHEFESGEWVEVIPIQQLKLKHKTRYVNASNSLVRLDAEGDVDKAAVSAGPGGWRGYVQMLEQVREAALIAATVTAWSYDVPLPEITPDWLVLNVESAGEADMELLDLLEPYRLKLIREPDPKGMTTSASNGRSKATAAALKA